MSKCGRLHGLLALGGAVLVGSCTTAPDRITHTPKAEKKLAEALAGRTPGPPVDCLPIWRTANMQVIDDWTILFTDGPTVYVQNPRGGCIGLANGGYTLVTRQFSANQVCSGDINPIVDLQTGMKGGACIFSPFKPYTKVD